MCPTVGGVIEGLAEGDAPDEVRPTSARFLATVDGVDDGRQHVWEAFPGRRGETTVYLFYYATAREPVSLADLYARFFAKLGAYKRGEARLVRPTFGFIPGWSRLAPAPSRAIRASCSSATRPRVTRRSPTAGSARRSDRSGARRTPSRASAGGEPIDACVVHDSLLHAITGALARLLSSRSFEGHELNRLLDAAFRTLHELGDDAYGALLRDEMTPPSFVAFLRRTGARHPAVWGQVMRGLGPWTAGKWGLGVARSIWSAA